MERGFGPVYRVTGDRTETYQNVRLFDSNVIRVDTATGWVTSVPTGWRPRSGIDVSPPRIGCRARLRRPVALRVGDALEPAHHVVVFVFYTVGHKKFHRSVAVSGSVRRFVPG